jgi:cytochrome P450
MYRESASPIGDRRPAHVMIAHPYPAMAIGPKGVLRHRRLPSEGLANRLLYLRKLLDLRLEGFAVRPGLPARFANFLRQHHPILLAPGIVLVTRYDDVTEVLRDSSRFAMNYPKAGPDQIVAMGDTPEFQHHLSIMGAAAHPAIPSLAATVREFAEKLLEEAGGRIDLVAGFSRRIAIMLTDKYLGVPAPPIAMMRWTRAIFRNVFTNFSSDPLMTAEAGRAIACLNNRTDRLAAIAREDIARGKQEWDFLHCLLADDAKRIANGGKPLSDVTVHNIVAGLACAMSETVSTAIAYSIKFLLDHPDHLPGAVRAARAGDVAILTQYVYEILRFSPEIPFLPRIATVNATVAAMTSRAAMIPENSLVLAATSSAMFDPLAFDQPESFKLNRGLDTYLHFGAGVHRCFGERIARIVVPEAIAAMLRREGLRPIRGAAGRMRFDGGFPNTMPVQIM